MDARPLARRLRLGRLRASVIFDERDVEHAVAQVARCVVAHLGGVHFLEAKNLAVELGGALQVLDLEREMHDAVHCFSCSRGLSLRASASRSSCQIASQSLRALAFPVTGATRS